MSWNSAGQQNFFSYLATISTCQDSSFCAFSSSNQPDCSYLTGSEMEAPSAEATYLRSYLDGVYVSITHPPNCSLLRLPF